MIANKVDFRATTTAVLGGFSHGFADMVIQLLEQRNTVAKTAGGVKTGAYVNVDNGNGLLVMVHYEDGKKPFTMVTEFLVPSNELAAKYMVMWRRWCAKRGVSSKDGLLSLIDKIIGVQEYVAQGNEYINISLALGLMGAVLDNHPECIESMRWSVDNGFAPCLVVANDNNQEKCGVCYGGKYLRQ